MNLHLGTEFKEEFIESGDWAFGDDWMKDDEAVEYKFSGNMMMKKDENGVIETYIKQ